MIKEKLKNLKKDKSSGASELIEEAVVIIKDFLNTISNETKDISTKVRNIAQEIIYSRPSMAPLINTIGYLIGKMRTINKKGLLKRIETLSDYREEQMKALHTHFNTLFNELYKPHLRLMLISHSSTINRILSSYKGKELIFYILESRPLLEGQKTAEHFAQYFETHLIVDAAMGRFIRQIDAVFLGIDSILSNGAIINKIGTYPLAVLSKANNKSCYVVGDSFKYNLRSHFGQEVSIERKSVKEIYDGKINENICIDNYYFDITPAKYIDKIISDIGTDKPTNFTDKVSSHLPIDWFKTYIKK